LVEIIVVENGGRFGLAEITENFRSQFPITYCYLEAANSGKARNYGASIARGDLLIFIDDDTKVVKDFFSAYATAYERFGANCFFGGSLSADYETDPPPSWLMPFLPDSARGFELNNGNSAVVTTTAFLGGNMAIPKGLLERVGGYDLMGASGGNNSGLLGEETRLQEMMLGIGASGVYVGDARVLHWVPADRCSLEWLVKRRRRSGATDAEIDLVVNKRMHRFPAWMARAWLEDSWRVLAARATGQPLEKYVAPLLHRAYLGGYIAHALSMRAKTQINPT
jgi:succinoglycan biosynthesis protein ExoM